MKDFKTVLYTRLGRCGITGFIIHSSQILVPEYWSAALRSGALSAGALVGAALYKLSWSTTRSGAPKKAGALVGAQLALQRSDKRIIHEKN